MTDFRALNALTERIHLKHHQGACSDIHPLVHAEQLAGFRNKALRILAARERAGATK